jgi:ribonucleoside-diphosphate reductase beta chain
VQYEAKFFYGFQIMMENIHSETYSPLIDTYVRDEAEKDKPNALEVFPAKTGFYNGSSLIHLQSA